MWSSRKEGRSRSVTAASYAGAQARRGAVGARPIVARLDGAAYRPVEMPSATAIRPRIRARRVVFLVLVVVLLGGLLAIANTWREFIEEVV